jgi:hypothetical protein
MLDTIDQLTLQSAATGTAIPKSMMDWSPETAPSLGIHFAPHCGMGPLVRQSGVYANNSGQKRSGEIVPDFTLTR